MWVKYIKSVHSPVCLVDGLSRVRTSAPLGRLRFYCVAMLCDYVSMCLGDIWCKYSGATWLCDTCSMTNRMKSQYCIEYPNIRNIWTWQGELGGFCCQWYFGQYITIIQDWCPCCLEASQLNELLIEPNPPSSVWLTGWDVITNYSVILGEDRGVLIHPRS